MKLFIFVVLLLCTLGCTLVIVLAETERSYTLRKDCALIEISPDFTQQEKDFCRSLKGKLKRPSEQ